MKYLRAAFILALLFLNIPGYCQNVLINEVMASNRSAFEDEDGDHPDWIELYNAGDSPVNLAGYGISDDPADPFKWILPEHELAPHGFLLVFASGKDRTGTGAWETIIDRGDSWRYYIPAFNLTQNWRLPGYDDSGWSLGHSGFGNGDGDDATLIGQAMSVYIRKTFSKEDFPGILKAMLHMDYDDAFVAYLNGQEIARANIGVIGEIPAFNQSASFEAEARICNGGYPVAYLVDTALLLPGENVLAIELHNFENSFSDLSLIPFFSLLLESPPENPEGTPALLQLSDPMLHTNFKISATGETLIVTHPSGLISDSLQCGYLPDNISTGRKPDGSGNWRYFNEPTPGMANSTPGWPGVTGPVQFSHSAGFYESGFQLTLSTGDPSDIIHYTLDGSEPGVSDAIYNTPLIIYETEVVRAVAIHEGYLPARSSTVTYFIDEDHDLPVFSISTAPENLFDANIGIYNDNNIWEDWERPIHLEFFDTDDSSGFSVDAGVKIFGGWTRTFPQKSLAIYARESYGFPEIEYAIFPDLPFNKYEGFILRNSGNDWQNTMFRDGLMTGLVAGDGVDVQAFRPSVVYINGEYWGIHNIREKLNDRYIEMHHQVDHDSLDLLENQDIPLNGDSLRYMELIAYIETHPMSYPANYETIKTRINIPEFITYEISQIYVGNTDWPGNNIKYWCPWAPGGQWNWMLYDTDFGFGLVEDYTFNTLVFATDPSGPDWPNPPWSTFMLREMLESNEFRIDFINRYADLMNSSFRPDVVLEQIDQKKTAIFSEMARHCGRWGGTVWEWLANVQVLQTFASNRKVHAQSHIIQYFDLVGYSQVVLDVMPASSGKIQISTLSLEEFPWTGEYFNGIPVNIRAIAMPGYRFKGWEGSLNSDSVSITISFSSDMELTAVFEAYPPDYLVINEINYNSSAEFNPGDWIEIYNPEGYEVDLEGWIFKDEEDTHSYLFKEESVISSEGFLVLCTDTAAFHNLFPEVTNYTGNFNFGLNGNGELLRLYDFSGLLIDSVLYDDTDPWPPEPDGNGPTLELIDPDLDNALPENWTASGQHGTPGSLNGIYTMVIETPTPNLHLEISPNPFHSKTNIVLISEKDQYFVIDIYNISGIRVKTIDCRQTGQGTFEWDGKDNYGNETPAGVYVCIINSDTGTLIRKLLKI